jgi:hypothetical protein
LFDAEDMGLVVCSRQLSKQICTCHPSCAQEMHTARQVPIPDLFFQKQLKTQIHITIIFPVTVFNKHNFVGKSERKRTLGTLMYILENNIKMDLKEMGFEDVE